MNKDFRISIFGDNDEEISLQNGENQIQWKKNKELNFNVKKVKTEFHGNCYVILPHEVTLTPGDQLSFAIVSSNTSKPEDKIGKMEFFLSTKVKH